MSQDRILLLGFGDIAQRLATRLQESEPSDSSSDSRSKSNRQKPLIEGVKRSALKHPTVTIHTLDCRNLEAMSQLLETPYDVIVMTFTPSTMSDDGYKQAYVDTVDTLIQALDQHKQQHQPRLLLFVSSSSVYHQSDSSWVDETSATQPSRYSGQRLLEAEAHLANSAYAHCSVRFSGIYGPGRGRLIQQVKEGKGSPKQPTVYSNRIHADDCAGVLAHLIEQQKQHGSIDTLYIGTDHQPAPLYEVKQWIASELDLPTDHLRVDNSAPVSSMRGASSKRCSNSRLLGTGYRFLYPSYQDGYKALINACK